MDELTRQEPGSTWNAHGASTDRRLALTAEAYQQIAIQEKFFNAGRY